MKNQYEKTNGTDWLLKEAIIYYTLDSLASHIIEYTSDFTTFEQVNREFILGFIGYLKTAQNFNYKKKGEIVRLVPNTQHNLFIKFSYIIKKAFKEGIIIINPLEELEHSDKPKIRKRTTRISDCR